MLQSITEKMKTPSSDKGLSHPLSRMGLAVLCKKLSSGAMHFHISAPEPQSSLVLAIPIEISDDSGVAHVLEHLLLTGSNHADGDSFFFRVRSGSSAVDMNAVTNTKYLAVHFTCNDDDEYFRLLEEFTSAIFEPSWQPEQLQREVGDQNHPGVITNEMTGVFSASHTYWALRTYAGLFSKGSSCFNPGGDPNRIAQVGDTDLISFWNRHFCVENLLVVSFGEVSGKQVQDKLEHCLASKRRGNSISIPPSLPISSPKVSRFIDENSPSQQIASGVLLPADTSACNSLDINLLSAFLDQCTAEIVERCTQVGITFSCPPVVKETDGDYFLFTVCTVHSAENIKELWSTITGVCVDVLDQLSPVVLSSMAQQAACAYFSLGNEKIGAGVAASLELVNKLCGSVCSTVREPGNDEIDQLLVAYESRDNWVDLLLRSMRTNPAQVTIDCDDNHAPIHHRFVMPTLDEKIDAKSIVGATIECITTDGDWVYEKARANTNWEVPTISHHPSSKIYHYRLPRPFLAPVKVSVALPKVVGSLVSEGLHNDWLKAVNPTDIDTDIKIEAKRCPGSLDYQLILSFASNGDISSLQRRLTVIDRFSIADTDLLAKHSGRKVAIKNVQQLPPHQQAILQSAAQLSDIAQIKLALAGQVSKDKQESVAARLMNMEWDQIKHQPRTVFLATSDKKTEIPELDPRVNGRGMDEPDAVISDRNSSLSAGEIKPVKEEPIPGSLNYCARVWTLPAEFGASASEDAIPYLLASLLTNSHLEPVLRGERRAYAAAADIDIEIGMMTMFSFRDPEFERTDQFFIQSFKESMEGKIERALFDSARQRTLSRLQDKGSFDLRCEKQFDRLVQGYTSDYFQQLRDCVATVSLQQFKESLPVYFQSTSSTAYALVAADRLL